MLSLGLGLAVLAAVGQIDRNLRNAIQDDLPERAPSYFFVDIQPDQLEGFLDRVEGDPAVSRVDTAPNLRGVVTQINGRPAREVAGNHWVVRGDRGLTYSATKPDNVTMAEGEWWPEDYDGPPLVSFAQEEAEEIGVGIGDTITMNILGREITATISSLRVVDFSTAGIGFVLSMNPAALAGAPHTHIATVYAEEEAEAAILRDLANAYPNITAIRVRDAIDNVTTVLSGIAAATSWAAGATLLTGFVVLIGAAAAGERARGVVAAAAPITRASSAMVMSWRIRSSVRTSTTVCGAATPRIVVRVTPSAKSRWLNSSAKRASWSTPTGPEITTSVTRSRQTLRVTSGGSASSGRVVTPSTAACTSAAARSMSQPGSNSSSIRARPSEARLEAEDRPSTAISAGSTGSITARSTSSGPAPSQSMSTSIASTTTSGKYCARICGSAARPKTTSRTRTRLAAVAWRVK